MLQPYANELNVPGYIKIGAQVTWVMNVAKNGPALAENRHTRPDRRNLNKNDCASYLLIAHFFSILRNPGFGARRALLRTSESMEAV